MRFPVSRAARFQRDTPITDQAAEWLATLSDEACSAEERREFTRWSKQSTTHVDEFLQISTLTRRLETAGNWPDVDLDALVKEARADAKIAPLHLSNNAEFSSRTPGVSRSRFSLAIAASCLLLIAGAFLAPAVSEWLTGRNSYATHLGELRSVTLEDGSIVQLNALSQIRTRFTPHERRIELLNGEAIFSVAKDSARPFKVATPFAEIVAVGTQFNVKSQPNQTIVSVLEVRVRLETLSSAANGPLTPISRPDYLAAGQQAVVQPDHAIQKIARIDAQKITGWTMRRLYFDNTPLRDAVRKFANGSAQVIALDDPDLANRKITGTFNSSDPAALVMFLERYGDTTVMKTKDGWTVRTRRPQK